VTESWEQSVTASTRTRAGLALVALAIGSFGIGTTEFVTMGVLPDVADGLMPPPSVLIVINLSEAEAKSFRLEVTTCRDTRVMALLPCWTVPAARRPSPQNDV
jgi:hypothetical protein